MPHIYMESKISVNFASMIELIYNQTSFMIYSISPSASMKKK